jgi:hypothetical protein
MKKMNRVVQVLCLVAPVMTIGCATITSNEIQPVSVTTKDDKGQYLEKAKCTLRNDKGAWDTESPAFVQVRRSSEDLLVECKKEGQPSGSLRAISRAAGGMWGNIIFGGGIGAIIDHSKGTGYNYPDTLLVKMGESAVVDRSETTKPPAETQEVAIAGGTTKIQ